MGNLLVENGRVRIPKSKSNVMVRLDDYNSFRTHIQRAIFDSANNAWGGAGFAWAFCEFTSRDQMNEAHQARIWPEMRSTYQQSYFYIDFMRIQRDSAYQLNWQSSFRPDPSTYISIDIGRGRGILPHADIVHETGHAIGLAHEHQRLDRTDYVTPINQPYYNDILSRGQQVGIQTTAQSAPFGPYDPDSVMHYPGTFKTKNGIPIGGTIQRPVFPNSASSCDMYTAIFLYNEARIQDYLEIRNNGFQKQYLGENAQVPFEVQEQDARLRALAEPYHQGNNPRELRLAILSRTHEAVENQMRQLERLRSHQPNVRMVQLFDLEYRQTDDALVQWAESNFNSCRQQVAGQHHGTTPIYRK